MKVSEQFRADFTIGSQAEDDEENEPYCDCDCEPDDEEDASNRCKSCGKALW